MYYDDIRQKLHDTYESTFGDGDPEDIPIAQIKELGDDAYYMQWEKLTPAERVEMYKNLLIRLQLKYERLEDIQLYPPTVKFYNYQYTKPTFFFPYLGLIIAMILVFEAIYRLIPKGNKY